MESRPDISPPAKFVIFSQNHDQVGNRLEGERLSTLVSFEALKLAAALVLLSPHIPLLFMGEEYGEEAPFLYFVSHSDPGLIEAVRQGRKKEFSAFLKVGEPPDPQDETTFFRSKIHLDLHRQGTHKIMFEYYKFLITLRKEIPPLSHLNKEGLEIKTSAEKLILFMVRRFEEEGVVCLFNFYEKAQEIRATLGQGIWQRVLDSSSKEWAGPGGSAPVSIRSSGEEVSFEMGPLSVVLYRNSAPRPSGELPQSPEKRNELFQAVVDHLEGSRRLPVSTYRLQFNHRFTFSQAKKVIPYLHELGISDVYASPCFLARKGSLHGYDILDHNRLNPEIGTEEEYQEWVKELEKYGMGQIQDIVPNHMCIIGNENNWWQDVLENGPGSLYADFFDIDWKPVKDELDNKVLLPILGDQYGRVLDNQELVLTFEAGAFFVAYADQKLPLSPMSYTRILKLDLEALIRKMGAEHPDLQELLSIITALEHLPPPTEKDPEKILERRREKEIIKKRISALYDGNKSIRGFIDQNIGTCNGQRGVPASFDLLDGLLNAQAYRFSHWRVATEEINYRRFFDINELVSLRVERFPVFLETHKLIFKLIREGKVSGLRVDHPDGLYNPGEYFYRLQKACFIQRGLRRIEQEMAKADTLLEQWGTRGRTGTMVR